MYISDLATAQRICYGSRLIYTQILEQDFLLHIKVSKFIEFQSAKQVCQLFSERTFSVTGFCITKFRCSLGDQFINALVLLKHIFQKEQQEKDKNFYISKLVPKIRPAKSTLRFSLILFLNRYSQVSIKRASLFNRDLRVDEVFLLQYECSMLPKFHSLF